MQHFSGIAPRFLTAGKRNAKTDFPIDYEAYFKDDAAVCVEFAHPNVKVITEPWKTPAMCTVVETRKTAMKSKEGNLYMLGAFCPHDDVELGITEFKAEKLPPALHEELDHVPEEWYGDAFNQLPFATLIMEGGKVVSKNSLAEKMGLDPTSLKSELEEVASLPDYDSYHFGNVNMGGTSCRVWCWRPDVDDREVIAVSARPKHSEIPSEVQSCLALS